MPKIVRKGSEGFFCLAEILLSFVQIFFVFVQKIKKRRDIFSAKKPDFIKQFLRM